jgi:cysteinyl-tRNA synthetase
MRIYNTYSKSLEDLVPLTPGEVRMYNCGPTVYDSPHVGNFRTFAFADTLRRYLEYAGFKVKQVMNITDVGHLTQDHIEAGIDKMEEGLRRLRERGVNVSDPYQVAEYYTKEYLEARRALGFRDAHVYPRATQHVPEMIEMIRTLLEKGFAYPVGGNIYFDVRKFAGYGKLSGNTLEQIKAGASERADFSHEKRHPADFALWKTDAKHLMQFDSPWGRGFPGWHIECSAMSRKHLGEQIDIHTGGEDNIFPHHESEIAQSESANGKPFAKYWMHARHLMWDGKKMSKSEGTFFTIGTLLGRGYSGLAIRYALVSTHYRMQVNYRLESFDDARKNIARINDFRRRLERERPAGAEDAGAVIAKARADFSKAMDDDLNTSGALAAVHEFITDINRALDKGTLSAAGAAKALETLRGFDSVFAFFEADTDAPAEVRALLDQRAAARAVKNFKESDRLRDAIRGLGWVVEDGKQGQTLKKA